MYPILSRTTLSLPSKQDLPMNEKWSNVKFSEIVNTSADEMEETAGSQTYTGSSTSSLVPGENNSSPLQAHLTYVLIGSVSLGALLGIICIFLNKLGTFGGKTISSTFLIAIFSLLGLACELAKIRVQQKLSCLMRYVEEGNSRPMMMNHAMEFLPDVGLVLTATVACLVLISVWWDLSSFDNYWKITGFLFIYAFAIVHVCLLSVARLPRRFESLFWIAFIIIFIVATVLAANIFYPVIDAMGVIMNRFLAALVIGDAAITSVLPMLHRIGTIEAAEAATQFGKNGDVSLLDQEIVRLEKQLDRLKRSRANMQGGLQII